MTAAKTVIYIYTDLTPEQEKTLVEFIDNKITINFSVTKPELEAKKQ